MASIYEQLDDEQGFYDLYREPTETDFEIAKANGISRKNVKQRLNYGYTIMDAITKPVTKNRKNVAAYEQRKSICEANGVGFKTFETRLRMGWDVDKAASKKPRKFRTQ